MKRTLTILSIAATTAAAVSIAFVALPSSAATPVARAATSASANGSVVAEHDALSLAAAQRVANAAAKDCADRGFAVTVAIVDTDGIDIVVQRADGATGATVDVARDKAHAAAGFQSPTGALQEQAKSNPGFIALPGFSILPGGEPIFKGKVLLGGIGVSGTPSGETDDMCALAGLKTIS